MASMTEDCIPLRSQSESVVEDDAWRSEQWLGKSESTSLEESPTALFDFERGSVIIAEYKQSA